MTQSRQFSEREAIGRERVRAVARQAPTIVVGNLVNASLTVWVCWSSVHLWLLLSWLGLIAAASSAALAGYLRFVRRGRGSRVLGRTGRRNGARRALSFAIVVGALWGAAAGVLIPQESGPQQVVLILVVAGTAAGGVPALAPVPAACNAFLLLALVPLALRLGFIAYAAPTGPAATASTAMAMMAVLFAGVLLWFGRAAERGFIAGVKARVRSDRLAADLGKARGFLESTLNNVEQGIIMIAPDGTVPVFNRRVLELLDLPEALLARRPHLDEVLAYQQRIGEFAAPGPKSVAAMRADAFSPGNQRYERQRPDGTSIEVRTIAMPEGGAVRTFSDITQRRATEAAMARAVAAEESNKLKTEFIANVSHELRTPLNAIIGFSELLGHEIHGPLGCDAYRGYVQDVLGSSRALLDMVNNVLDLAMIEAGHLTMREETIDVAEIVGMCVRAAGAAAAAANVELTVDYDRDAALIVRVDPRRLRQAIASLLSNALKFTHAGGAVRVEVARRASRRAGEPPLVSIAITDTGKGMSIEEMEIAFQSFRQVDGTLTRRCDGIGIGLPLAKRLCDAMGGRLTLDSAPARGTTAWVELPALPALALA